MGNGWQNRSSWFTLPSVVYQNFHCSPSDTMLAILSFLIFDNLMGLLALQSSTEMHSPVLGTTSSSGVNRRPPSDGRFGERVDRKPGIHLKALLLHRHVTLCASRLLGWPQFPHLGPEIALMTPFSPAILRALLQIACGGQCILLLPCLAAQLEWGRGGRKKQGQSILAKTKA